jgi:hypothetical protein
MRFIPFALLAASLMFLGAGCSYGSSANQASKEAASAGSQVNPPPMPTASPIIPPEAKNVPKP